MNAALASSANTAHLSPEDVEHFHREGYVLPQGQVFPQADFRDLQRAFEAMLADWTAQGGRPEAMDVPHFYHPELMRWLLHPAVLDLVEPITGPDIVLFSSHFICKPAGDGRRVPWHEDSAYWRGQWDPMEVVTVWLAIDDSDLGNGCMHVVPRTHLGGYSEYDALSERAVFASEIKAGTFAADSAAPCILTAGSCSLHHAKAIHGSGANTSTRRRCGYTMRYISAAARFDQARNSDVFQIYQARGRNLAGNALADPGRANARWIERFGVQPPKGH